MRLLGKILCLLLLLSVSVSLVAGGDFHDWDLSRAVEILNDSPWARQETYTRVLGGVGSGIQGEKEIYNTFFVRFLSAAPVRKAYARIKQLQLGYESLPAERRARVDREIQRGVKLNFQNWIVVAVSFRSNDLNQESRVEQFLQGQTAETLKPRTYLSTEKFPRVPLEAYYPPREESVGAKFVFPRFINGLPVVTAEDDEVIFELDVPGANPQLRATFSVDEMILNDRLIL